MSRKSRKHAVQAKPPAGPPTFAPARGTAAPSRRVVMGIAFALFVAVLLAFGRSVTFDFVDFDDPGTVSENPFVSRGMTVSGVLHAFSHAEISNWIPLTVLSHMLDCQIFGLWAGGHHLTSILLHAVTSILLFLLLRDMTGCLWRCALVAALFSLHPLRVESVVWISERKDLLGGFFFVLTLWAYTRWTRHTSRGFVWVAVFLALGLLSKAMLVTTPFVLFLLDHWPLRRTSHTLPSKLVIEKLPLLLLCVAVATVQLLVAREAIDTVTTAPLSGRAANAIVSCATYVVQVFWPSDLAVFYPFPRQGVGAQALLGASALLLLISGAAWRWRRQAPWFAVGWLWYLVMLAPVLGFIQAGEVARADRYTYLPHIGLYLAIAWAAATWCAKHSSRSVAVTVLTSAALIAAALAAFRQTGYWKDSDTLWNRALACTANNDTAHYNLGTARLRSGDLDAAIFHYRQTLAANPAYADAHINLGRAFLQQGNAAEALVHYRKAMDIKPAYAEAHYNIALVFAAQGQPDDAIRHYQRALEIKPAYFDARNNLGSVLLQSGRITDAIAEYEVALRVEPSSARAHNNLAAALVQKGRIPAAIMHYERAIALDPSHAAARNGLAWLLATHADSAVRNGARAIELAQKAVDLTSGGNPLMLRTLAAAFAEAGRFDEARQAARRALDLATGQGSSTLAQLLHADLQRYEIGKPVR